MTLFANLLLKGYKEAGNEAKVWQPTVFFGKLVNSSLNGPGKWIAYIDKWIVFPLVLLIRLLNPKNRKASVRFHICDHSNAIYLKYLPNHKTIVSCHDVLAIRGALGFKDAYCEASKFGVILQKWILSNLLKADKVAAVSTTTLNQLNDLDKNANRKIKDRRVILNSFNDSFLPMPKKDAIQVLIQSGVFDKAFPFILHIGSSLPRKNRKVLVRMLNELKDEWNGFLVLAGQDIDEELKVIINDLKLNDRVISVLKPNKQILENLYSACDAFVFPSYSEGFGWPIIEAQACGAPVLASNVEPIPEVSGNAALLIEPDDFKGFAEAFRKLGNDTFRSELVQKGFVNCKRFETSRMIKDYLDFHNKVKAI